MKSSFLAGLLLFAGTLFSSPAAAQATSPLDVSLSSVLQAYFTWRGGEAFEHLQTIHSKGFWKNSAETTNEYWVDRTGRSRDELDFGGVEKIHVATPEAAWSINPSGQAQDDPAGSTKARRRALIEFGDALRGQGGAQVALLGGIRRSLSVADQEEDRLWAAVGVKFCDDDVYDLLIDPVTGELGSYVFEECGQTFTYEFADWRLVDGVRMPFRTLLNADTEYNDTQLTVLELNRPFDQSLFSRAAPRGGLSYRGREKTSGWIKFELDDGQILLPVSVNGHRTTAWLDSGASMSVVAPQFADQADLTSRGGGGAMTARGVGPAIETGRWRTGADITLGALTLKDLTLGALETSSFVKAAAGDRPLILGQEAFAELVVDLDFPHRRIRFLDPASFSKPAGTIEIPLLRDGDFLSVPVSIEGRKPIQAVFDLGYSGTLSVFPDYARQEKLLDGRKLSQSMFGGIGGIQTETDIILKTLAFGGGSLSDVPAGVTQQRIRGTYSNKVQGTIGVEILGRYRLICDFPHSQLFAIQDPKAAALPFGKNRLGVSWLPEGNDILVMLVVPNSLAAEVGLKAGDKIAWINGQPAKGWQSSAARTALKEGPAGRKVTFTLDNGESKTVTLSDYY